MRTISALFQAAGNALLPNARPQIQTEEPLELRVASLTAGVAAAIAQAQSRGYEDDDDDDYDDAEDSGSGREICRTGPNTSGVRGYLGENGDRRPGDDDDEDDDSDAFPLPLRSRKSREILATVGMKRKR